MVVIVFGVSGAGKTVVGQLLARELGWQFYDADDFHPAANIEKMHAGVSLTDDDRKPWLEKLRGLIEQLLKAKQNSVLACSALKKKYRDLLRVSDEVQFVYLRGDRTLIADHLRKRRGHFMNPALLDSQFADLEEPERSENALTVELGRAPEKLVDEIRERLGPTSAK